MKNQLPVLNARVWNQLTTLGTCDVSNAIEQLNVRPRSEGFVRGTTCVFPAMPPMLAYAVPATVRSSMHPMAGRPYYHRTDWWRYVLTIPEPRVLVLQDIDPEPGLGAFVGAIHVHIGRALGCVGCVTNGAVRDLNEVSGLNFSLFARNTSVSHSYAHIVEFGEPVEVGGVRIAAGDLLHGDRHGVLSIPLETAGALPALVASMRAAERELIEFCSSPEFSIERLATKLEAAPTTGEAVQRRSESE